MTAYLVYQLSCDVEDGCVETFSAGYLNLAETRSEASAAGWELLARGDDTFDVCPEHKP